MMEIKAKWRRARTAPWISIIVTMLLAASLAAGAPSAEGRAKASPAPASGVKAPAQPDRRAKWTRPDDWPATPESSRAPYSAYYQNGELPRHDPVPKDGLGLVWRPPLWSQDLGGERLIDLGGVYCPTLAGREDGGGARYRGVHRGHDRGIADTRLDGKKILVRLVADGVYDGRREYAHADPLPKDCKPMVFYHFSREDPARVYTSIYCHVEPLPELEPGQWVAGGAPIARLEDPEGAWGAHVHLELYTRPVYSSKDSAKFGRCGCKTDAACDALAQKSGLAPRGCAIFEDDLYLVEPMLFIESQAGRGAKGGQGKLE